MGAAARPIEKRNRRSLFDKCTKYVQNRASDENFAIIDAICNAFDGKPTISDGKPRASDKNFGIIDFTCNVSDEDFGIIDEVCNASDGKPTVSDASEMHFI